MISEHPVVQIAFQSLRHSHVSMGGESVCRVEAGGKEDLVGGVNGECSERNHHTPPPPFPILP